MGVQKPKRQVSEWRFVPPPGASVRPLALPDEDGVVLVVPVTESSTRASPLSSAEREIAGFVLDGKSNEEIAEARRTSVRTVANQLQSIYRKLGVGSRVELVRSLVDERAAGSRARQRGTSSRSKQAPK